MNSVGPLQSHAQDSVGGVLQPCCRTALLARSTGRVCVDVAMHAVRCALLPMGLLPMGLLPMGLLAVVLREQRTLGLPSDVQLRVGLQPEPRGLERAAHELLQQGLRRDDRASGLLQEGRVHRLGGNAAGSLPSVELARNVHPEVRKLFPKHLRTPGARRGALHGAPCATLLGRERGRDW
jgi:hypothetical protein